MFKPKQMTIYNCLYFSPSRFIFSFDFIRQ